MYYPKRFQTHASFVLWSLLVVPFGAIGLKLSDTPTLPGVITAQTIPDSSAARLDTLNRTGSGGEDPLSRNFNWSAPLVGLKGRAGLDLGLSLTYNSLVWTKTGSYISFDDDQGFPGPGFRLGLSGDSAGLPESGSWRAGVSIDYRRRQPHGTAAGRHVRTL